MSQNNLKVLQASNINKYFFEPEKFQVLKNISFEAEKGEFLSLVGNLVVENQLYYISCPRWIQIMREN